ncbi:hypothetical protein [Thermogutta sp.]|jgi:hypothetical protein|uniref:hypothetical protein n=1 Tax=Thermogutta sp. TaxID=1962930 RepID=UPI00322078B2
MKPICPSCHQEIPVEDVHLETGLGRCRYCNEIFEIPELVEHIKTIQAAPARDAPKAPPVKPIDTRIRLIRKNDKMLIDLPPGGLKAPAVGLLLFSLFWLAFVAFWTASALGLFFNPGKFPKWENIVFALFSIPFWFVGLGLFGGALAAMFSRRIVYLDSSWLESHWKCLFLSFRKRVSREDVQMVRVATPPIFRADSGAQAGPWFGVEIVYLKGKIKIPCESEAEQNWLLAEINQFLETVPYQPNYLSEGYTESGELFGETSSKG